ncbi:MAG: hypothetical protein RJA22_2204 [Verrucomicrobiota bacterium]
MNLSPAPQRPPSGGVLLVTLFIMAAIGIVLMAALNLIQGQNQAVSRSQAWNACIPAIEAGVEEALAHLNDQASSSLAANGWIQDGPVYLLQRSTGNDSFFRVALVMTNPAAPIILSTGYVRLAALVAQAREPLLAAATPSAKGEQYINRAVRVLVEQQMLFVKAMVARDRIEMNGNNISVDSYDSSNPLYSTPQGTYDPAKARDNGDVSTIAGVRNAISVGNADIKGRVSTGPGGTVAIGPNGSVGSKAWVDGGRSGIQPGWFRDDMNVDMRNIERPSSAGSLGTPAPGTVNGIAYGHVVDSGKYVMSSINLSRGEKMCIRGGATLIVDGPAVISGGLDILPGASLTLYVRGPNLDIGGIGVNNTQRSTNCVIFGLPTLTSVTLPSSGDFNGALYAPNADLRMTGGGSGAVNWCGACVTRTVTVTGHQKFHYDEGLRTFGPPGRLVVTSWLEL